MDPISHARRMVDEVHGRDPNLTREGAAAELVYADRIESWVRRLVPDASPLLLLAARCQHLERWSTPRDAFPMDRVGYNAWRRIVHGRQADCAREILIAAGIPTADADEVATWVSKAELRRNSGTQALEDAACLVFLENEIVGFAEKHQDYSKEKYLTIVRRIWRKMSPSAREMAWKLEMAPAIAGLLREATSE